MKNREIKVFVVNPKVTGRTLAVAYQGDDKASAKEARKKYAKKGWWVSVLTVDAYNHSGGVTLEE